MSAMGGKQTLAPSSLVPLPVQPFEPRSRTPKKKADPENAPRCREGYRYGRRAQDEDEKPRKASDDQQRGSGTVTPSAVVLTVNPTY